MSRARLALWASVASAWAALVACWVWWPAAPDWVLVAAITALAGALWVIEATAARPRRPRPPGAAQEPPGVNLTAGGQTVARVSIPGGLCPFCGHVADGHEHERPAATVEETLAAVEAIYPGAALAPPAAGLAPAHDHSPGSSPCPACLVSLRMLAGTIGASVEVQSERRATEGERAAAMLAEAGGPLTSGPACGNTWRGHACRVRPEYGREHFHECVCGRGWGWWRGRTSWGPGR